MRNADPSYEDDGKPGSSFFHYLPRHQRVYVITLIDGILVCSCCWAFRFGCPCRHLFAIEPCYDIRDVEYRWHTPYAYYAYSPGHEELTQLYESSWTRQICGIILKSVVPSKTFPFKWSSCEYDLQDFLSILESPVPLCWNYSVDKYPEKYRIMLASVPSPSDGDFDVDDCSLHSFGLTQESIGVGIAHDAIHESMAYVRTRKVDDPTLMTQFKTMLPYFVSAESKAALLDVLKEAEHKQRIETRDSMSMTTENPVVGDQFVSVHLPIGKQKESKQFRRKRRRV